MKNRDDRDLHGIPGHGRLRLVEASCNYLPEPTKYLSSDLLLNMIVPSRAPKMATKKVVVYFEDQRDALHFTLAAGTVMSDQIPAGKEAARLLQPLARASRVFIDQAASSEEDYPAALSQALETPSGATAKGLVKR